MLARYLVSAYRRSCFRQAPPIWSHIQLFSATSSSEEAVNDPEVTVSEAKRLMRLVNVDEFKKKLGENGGEVIGYNELLRTCESMGVTRTGDEAENFARALDEAGVVLLFRDKVYLHPDKVADLVRKAVPLALTPPNDPRKEELRTLIQKKQEIDKLAHKQVRRILFAGLFGTIAHVGLFFRLTFWEFSWDVMEPIAFFTTATGLVIGYGYFLITDRDPTYQDFMERLFSSRQKKLISKQKFDMERYLELRKCVKDPFDKICRENIGESNYNDFNLHK